jgi:hypothetical protein
MLEGEQTPKGVVAGMPGQGARPRITKCIWRKMNGQHVSKTREMPTKYIPIVRVVGNQWIIEGKPVVSGLVRNAKDAQRMYNYNASMEVEMNALAPKAPFIGMAEQFEGHEDKWRRRTASRTPSCRTTRCRRDDRADRPVRRRSACSRRCRRWRSSRRSSPRRTTSRRRPGSTTRASGSGRTRRAGKAINARQRESDVGTFHYVDNLARALRYAGTIILDMAPKSCTTRSASRGSSGEDGEPDHVMIDPNQPQPMKRRRTPTGKIQKIYNLGVGKYDVVVNTGPSFTTKRRRRPSS